MARLGLSQAARLAGVSRSPMNRALKAGRVSTKPTKGASAGLIRPRLHAASLTRRETIRETTLLHEMVADLRERLAASDEERRQLTLRLLSNQRPWGRRWRRTAFGALPLILLATRQRSA